VRLRVNISGQKKILAAMLKMPQETSKVMRVALKQSFTDIQTEAVKNSGYTPRSGNLDRLVSSPTLVRVLPSGMRGQLTLVKTTQVPYSIIQHEGGRAGRNGSVYIKPKKFISRAAKAKEQAVLDIISNAMGKAIKNAGL
jgi:phage gpG-like protein